jgi:NAD(P)-dependent dehydrogenase (short-subunit alcohol dehydrogenase family)
MTQDLQNRFDLTGRVAIITGGAGFLGQQHAQAILAAGGTAVLLDLPVAQPREKAEGLSPAAFGVEGDITRPDDVARARDTVLQRFGRIDILVNNAANNPKMEAGAGTAWTRLEHFPLDLWQADLAVGLTGAFLCSQAFGTEMARQRRGVIVNIASDLAVIAPDQRLYRQEGVPEDQQPVKPVTYSVVKTALLGLTRYLATYWADAGVRVNALSPGGVFNGQQDVFVQKLTQLIPLGRMASADEYQSALLFLCSDASSYMTGANLVIDGGRSCW